MEWFTIFTRRDFAIYTISRLVLLWRIKSIDGIVTVPEGKKSNIEIRSDVIVAISWIKKLVSLTLSFIMCAARIIPNMIVKANEYKLAKNRNKPEGSVKGAV